MTAGVDELVRQGRLNPSPYLRRHLHGDWGDRTTAIDGRTTPRCNPVRIVCSRPTGHARPEALDHHRMGSQLTTLLLPSEY